MNGVAERPAKAAGGSIGLRPWELAVAVFLAVVLVVISSPPLAQALPFDQSLRGGDITDFWRATHSLVSGGGVLPYRGGVDLFYPAPYIVLLAPLGLLSSGAAADAARVLGALLLVGVIAAWGLREGRVRLTAWTLALSLPAVTTVYLGQLPAALGLAAFSIAIWAQRRDRWWLAGLAVAVGLIRPANALPVVALLVVGGWGRWRSLAVAGATALAVLLPATALITAWDPGWLPDYVATVGQYRFGIPAVLGRVLGLPGVLFPQVVAIGLAVYWSRREAGRPLDPDRSAAVLALTVLVAPLSAAYAGIYGIPGLLRLSQRPSMAAVAPLAAAVPWLAALAPAGGVLSFYILGPSLAAVFVLVTIPALLRRRP